MAVVVKHAFVSPVVDAGNASEVGPSEWNADHTVTGLDVYTALNDQTGTAYTFVLADAGALVSGNNASSQTFTVPPNSSAAFATGSRIDLWQKGAGQITVAAGAGVTIRSSNLKLKLATQYSAASLTKIATDEWLLFGDITT